MSRSTFTMEPEVMTAIDELPERVAERAEAIKQVTADGAWSVPEDLAVRLADSLLSITNESSRAHVIRQAAECYLAVAADVIRSADLQAGYAQVAADPELDEVRDAMRGRAGERWRGRDD